MEATFYSFVLAIINVAYLISYQLGGLLTLWLGVTDTNFDNLWILILIASVYPILNLPFMWCLLPMQKKGEDEENLIEHKVNLSTKAS